MFITLQATYINVILIQDSQLRPGFEGKTLKMIIIEPEDLPNIDEASTALAKVEAFLKTVQQYSFKIPTDYAFNRDELYDRSSLTR